MPQNLSSCGGVVFSQTGSRTPFSLPGWQSKDKGKKWLHAIAIEAIPYMTKEALVEVRHTYHGCTPMMHCPGLRLTPGSPSSRSGACRLHKLALRRLRLQATR